MLPDGNTNLSLNSWMTEQAAMGSQRAKPFFLGMFFHFFFFTGVLLFISLLVLDFHLHTYPAVTVSIPRLPVFRARILPFILHI